MSVVACTGNHRGAAGCIGIVFCFYTSYEGFCIPVSLITSYLFILKNIQTLVRPFPDYLVCDFINIHIEE